MTDLHKIAFDYRNAVLPDDAHEAWIELEQYVKQLINEERASCAQVCEEVGEHPSLTPRNCAEAIRAREQQ